MDNQNLKDLKNKPKLSIPELEQLGEYYFWQEPNNRARTEAMIKDGLKESRIVTLGVNINRRNLALTGDPGEQISKIVQEPEMRNMYRAVQQQIKRTRSMER